MFVLFCTLGILSTWRRNTWRSTMWGIGLGWLHQTRTAMCMSYVTSTLLRMRVKRKTKQRVDLVLCLFFDLVWFLKDVISDLSLLIFSELYCSRVLNFDAFCTKSWFHLHDMHLIKNHLVSNSQLICLTCLPFTLLV